MLRSMSSAITGLRNHQVYMDVVANNISNVNTTAFKASRVDFKEAIAQTIQAASAGTATSPTGGKNPIAVGLGVSIGSIDTTLNQGSLINTGKNTDVAIQGEGYFTLGTYDSGTGVTTAGYYTRDGSFTLDSNGYLVDRSTGYFVMDTSATPARIRIDPAWGWATFSIGQDGTMTGVLSSGATDAVNHPQIALAKFANPEGLTKTGNNLFQASTNSGTATLHVPGTNGTGTLVNGSLEASNVDLAEQFSRMIMAERGFQANSRVITASDEMLQDLVNIKR